MARMARRGELLVCSKGVVSSRPKHRALVFAPFLLIAVLFATSDLLAMHRVAEIRNQAVSLVENTVASIQLVSRMRHNVDELEYLVDRHILAKEAERKSVLEAQIEGVKADYRESAAAYEQLPFLPGEAAQWEEVKAEVAGLHDPVERALALSRRNEDTAARRLQDTLDDKLASVFRGFRALMELNHASADETVARVEKLQKSATRLLQLLALAGIVLAGAVGVAMTRLLQRREELQVQHAQVLEATNRELDAFAGRVAHDLRGPLTTVTLATRRLGKFAPPPDKSVELVGRSLLRMEALIDDLLALSRMQIGTQLTLCNPAAAAAQVREDLGQRAESSNAGLALDVETAWVHCSEALLRQVIWNMVDNAMKYRRPDVRLQVDVRGRRVDNAYELTVSDNGVGMSPEEAARAFDPFYRASRRAGEPGTGLGLSIVKRVIEASGGDVSVESEVGRGSTFVVHLPLA
jgi:signal transduction histidine kinase